jgi:type II pantothenate kinase
MSVVIGIDVGGSTTKIVGFSGSGAQRALMKPLFVRANDPITSIYGAFGKFTDENGLELADIEKVMITGAGSSYCTRPLYSLDCEVVPEFRCIGLGGLYLSSLQDAIIASLGTGTAIVHAKKGEAPVYLGGTGVGGGTLVGLSRKLLNMDDVLHVAELAKEGDLKKVDLKIKDITSKDIIPGYGDLMTASNFGKVSDLASKADIALGLINMVFETVGMVSIFAARTAGLSDIVLTGNLTTVPQAEAIFAELSRMFSVHFMIPEHAQYSTVIGAALCAV